MLDEDACLLLTKCFDVRICGRGYAVVDLRPGWEECFKRLNEGLVGHGLQAKLQIVHDQAVVLFLRVKNAWDKRVFAVLAVVTIITVALAGIDVARLTEPIAKLLGANWGFASMAIAFSIGLLAPLALHESGHYIAARSRRVPASPPMFLPAPPPSLGGFGTFGAIIRLRGLPYDRDSLALLGIAGPLAGFVAALIPAIVGSMLSISIPPGLVESLVASGRVETWGFKTWGFTPLILILLQEAVGNTGIVYAHPFLLASFIVFVITFLNLLPIGQLDGGHVIYAVFGEKVHMAATHVTPLIAIMASLLYPPLFFVGLFAVFAYALNAFVARGATHPGVLNPYTQLSPGRAAVYAALYTSLLVLTAPVPT